MGLEEIVKKDYVENDPTLCFKTTPLWKVLVLGLLWGGFYILILTYNYWKILRDNFGYKIRPLLRAFFYDITNFMLFPLFGKYFRNFGEKLVAPLGLAFLCLILTTTSFVLDKLMDRIEDLNLMFLIIIGAFFITLVFSLIFVYIQSIINKVNKEHFPEAPTNGWTVANTVWTIIGVLQYLFTIGIMLLAFLVSAVE